MEKSTGRRNYVMRIDEAAFKKAEARICKERGLVKVKHSDVGNAVFHAYNRLIEEDENRRLLQRIEAGHRKAAALLDDAAAGTGYACSGN